MTKFESRFLKALNEQDEDRQAIEQSLDQGTDPGKFDVSPTNGNTDAASQHLAAAAQVTAQQHAEYVKQIEGWFAEVGEIYRFLNASDGTSILSVISNAPEKTILSEALGEKACSLIERAAKEISALSTLLESAISSKTKPELAGV